MKDFLSIIPIDVDSAEGMFSGPAADQIGVDLQQDAEALSLHLPGIDAGLRFDVDGTLTIKARGTIATSRIHSGPHGDEIAIRFDRADIADPSGECEACRHFQVCELPPAGRECQGFLPRDTAEASAAGTSSRPGRETMTIGPGDVGEVLGMGTDGPTA